jgi:ribosomal protein L11 methyltransferase
MKEKVDFEMDTGNAFGTGSHPTTVLCLNLIERWLEKGDNVLDVGTGSGILMIAAAKLGAEKVIGIDNNKAAVEIARKNLLLNKIPRKRFAVWTGNLVDGVDVQFDLVVANLLPQTLAILMDDVHKILKKRGIFICSGMLEDNSHRVVGKMQATGFKIIETRTKIKWAALAGRLIKPVWKHC